MYVPGKPIWMYLSLHHDPFSIKSSSNADQYNERGSSKGEFIIRTLSPGLPGEHIIWCWREQGRALIRPWHVHRRSFPVNTKPTCIQIQIKDTTLHAFSRLVLFRCSFFFEQKLHFIIFERSGCSNQRTVVSFDQDQHYFLVQWLRIWANAMFKTFNSITWKLVSMELVSHISPKFQVSELQLSVYIACGHIVHNSSWFAGRFHETYFILFVKYYFCI